MNTQKMSKTKLHHISESFSIHLIPSIPKVCNLLLTSGFVFCIQKSNFFYILPLLLLIIGCEPEYLVMDSTEAAPIFLDAGIDSSKTIKTMKSVSCELGTPDNCSKCGDRCPPLENNESTERLCLNKQCLIKCKPGFYNVNEKIEDGCEAEDDKPAHSKPDTAKNLGELSDCDNVVEFDGFKLPSDYSATMKNSHSTVNHQPDWFKIHIKDVWNCQLQAKIEFSLKDFSPNSIFTVSGYYVCDHNSKQLQIKSFTVNGGSATELNPQKGCNITSLGSDSGWLYFSIAKLTGPHSVSPYSIKVTP